MRRYDVPKAILFDLDGTLINTMEGFADLAAELMERDYNMPFKEGRRNYITTSGIPFKHQLEVMFPGDSRNYDVQKEFEERKQNVFFNTIPDNDTIDAVRRLKDMNIKVIVSSNNYHDFVLKYFSENSSLKFDMILGYKDGFAKGKDHILHVVEAFNISRKDMIFVGDSLHDGEVADELEIPFIGRIAIRTREEFLSKFTDILCVDRLGEISDLFTDY
ncbi:MAG TPA: HAD hydrolase-like protein [Spirochaetota bacterium]|nr:HAD hydrolase-like protein [Spirochaetota bacterium]